MNKVDEEVVNDLQKLLTLIEAERREEHVYFFEYLAKMPIQQKVKEGTSWYPIWIRESGYGMGDYPYLILENKTPDSQGQLSAGKQIKLYNSQDEKEFIIGSVYYVDGNSMKVVFMLDDLPDWVDSAKLAVDMMFDDRSFKEMEKAVNTVINAKNCKLAELANICYGKVSPQINQQTDYYQNRHLNESQNAAVNAIIQSSDLALVHGPPGTGKTTTLVAAIGELCKAGEQILVCTPSNAAADHIAMEISRHGLNAVRIGNVARISPELFKITIEGLLEGHARQKELRDFKWQALEYRRMAGKYKRSFGPEERRQRDLLYKEARSLSTEARSLEDFMVWDIMKAADVIVTTLVGSESKYMEKMKFTTVVIDEAAQALEPASWIPICRADRVVMAGDPFQLPPTVKSQDAAKAGLSYTLMERCMKTQPSASHLLDTQYRMHENIMEFSNMKFYHNQLKAHSSVAKRGLPDQKPTIEFIDMAGCGFEEEQDPETLSLFNEGEIKAILAHLRTRNWLSVSDPLPSIAIISPYRKQVQKLEEYIKQEDSLIHMIKVNTIDSFQGQERDIVYISLVRSNNNGDIGFLKDYRRMNVAMTRAKKKLVIVGDSATLSNDNFYSDFLNLAEKKGYHESAWNYLYSG